MAIAGASTDEEAGAIGVASEDEEVAIGAADDEAGAIGVASDDDIIDEDAGAIGVASEDDGAIGAADDELIMLEDELTGVTVVVVAGPRLKIQIRPMITITTTMMIIQVLRFMG